MIRPSPSAKCLPWVAMTTAVVTLTKEPLLCVGEKGRRAKVSHLQREWKWNCYSQIYFHFSNSNHNFCLALSCPVSPAQVPILHWSLWSWLWVEMLPLKPLLIIPHHSPLLQKSHKLFRTQQLGVVWWALWMKLHAFCGVDSLFRLIAHLVRLSQHRCQVMDIDRSR